MALANQSARRAAQILIALGATNEGLAARELAASLGIPRQTTYHLLRALEEEGLVLRSDGRFLLGLSVGVVAEGFLRQFAPVHLQRAVRALAAETGESACAAFRHGEQFAILFRANGHHPVRAYDNAVGEMHDPHARASGKVLLAFAPAEIVERRLEQLEPRTSRTKTNVSRLRGEFNAIRNDRVCVEEEEYTSGISCVAAPVGDGPGLYVLALSAPADRFREFRAAYVQATQRIAKSALGDAVTPAK
jgi:IclR family transcriptional regulator, acetate operon repressor